MVSRTLTPAQAAVEKLQVPRYVAAGKARVGPSDFGRIIRGRQTPTRHQAERIAAVLGASVESLFGPVNELEPPMLGVLGREPCVPTNEQRPENPEALPMTISAGRPTSAEVTGGVPGQAEV